MKTVAQVLTLSCQYLKESGSSFGRLEVEWLIATTLGINRLDLYMNFDKPLIEEELKCIRQKLKRLSLGEPLQYIEGQVSFYGCTLSVDSRVLIPRPETEELVHTIVSFLKQSDSEGKIFVDIGTGSGCIGIACKKSCPELRVILSDTSSAALAVAKENAEKNGVEVECRLGDLLEPVRDLLLDFVVSNPPYISEEEFLHLEPHVRNFEPKTALVGGKTGLEVYERLAGQLKTRMRQNGHGWFEIGATQGEAIDALLTQAGYKNVHISKDFAGTTRFVEFTV